MFTCLSLNILLHNVKRFLMPRKKGEETFHIHALVPLSLNKRLDDFCQKTYVNKTSILILALKKYMDEMEDKK